MMDWLERAAHRQSGDPINWSNYGKRCLMLITHPSFKKREQSINGQIRKNATLSILAGTFRTILLFWASMVTTAGHLMISQQIGSLAGVMSPIGGASLALAFLTGAVGFAIISIYVAEIIHEYGSGWGLISAGTFASVLWSILITLTILSHPFTDDYGIPFRPSSREEITSDGLYLWASIIGCGMLTAFAANWAVAALLPRHRYSFVAQMFFGVLIFFGAFGITKFVTYPFVLS